MSPLHKNREYYDNTDWTVDKVREEINQGLSLLNSVDRKIITFFGSHKAAPSSPYYQHCEALAFQLGKQGYAIMTGGGSGIMHAANTGATKAKVPSIGLPAELLKGEKVSQPIYTHKQSFHFLFVRRFIMSIKSEALIFYPGGFGTLNELFEYATLMQTGVTDTVPIICVNRDYWKGLLDWIRQNPLRKDFLISDEADVGLLHFLDSTAEITKLIESGTKAGR